VSKRFSPDELTEYHREFNAESIDGLPTPLGGLLAASPPDVTPPA
jgi:hypothetical protein